MNTYKAHELRMWIVQIIIPTTLVGVYVCKNTNVVPYAKQKIHNIKRKLTKKH